MDSPTSLTSLMIVVAAAFLVPIALHRLRLRAIPIVVAEIVAGLIIGKSGLNIVTEDTWLKLLSLLGFIYLMFLSGVEIDFSLFRNKPGHRGKGEPNPFAISMILFLIILALACVMALGLVRFGFVEDPYLITLIIATISLGVVMPVLKERKMIDTKLGQTLLLITVISDFITMILLAVYLSTLSHDNTRMLLLLLFFAAAFGIYILARRFTNFHLFSILGRGTVQLGTRAIFALILLFVVLSESLGVESILGAFLAGVIVSLLMPNKDFTHQLDTFGYGFLIPIFFVMVGVKLDIWSLLADLKMLVLIPLLIMLIFLSKMIPVLLLRRWYSWPKVMGTGFLLSSTLSLVIAASTIALDMGLIDERMNGALIMVAILTCLIFPVLFNRVFPRESETPSRVAIIGSNHVTLPVAQDLLKAGYDVQMYSRFRAAGESGDVNPAGAQQAKLETVMVSSIEPDELAQYDVFKADIAVFGSMDDEANIRLARHARTHGMERIIATVEDPARHEDLKREGYAVFSTLYASRIWLKALIEHPGAIQLISENEETIHQITVENTAYHQTLLRSLPLNGDILVLRIYRGSTFLIPHGNTEIETGDVLLASGEADAIHALRTRLE